MKGSHVSEPGRKRCAWLAPWLAGFQLLLMVGVAAQEEESAAPSPEGERITIEGRQREGSVIHYFDSGLAVGTNGVVVTYQDAVLTADTVRLNEVTGDVIAEGAVQLQRANQVWRGERLHYNFRTEQMEAGSFKAGMAPVYIAGQGFRGDLTNQVYSTEEAIITTADVSNPVYYVKAESLTVVPGEYVEVRGGMVYLGRVPVFYWPYHRRYLNRNANYFDVTPGYRSRFGPFLLGSYHWYASEQLRGEVHLDYRLQRGVGMGPDLEYDLGRAGEGKISGYYAQDQDPDERGAVEPIPSDRYRVAFAHRASIRTNLTAMAVVRKQSDPLMRRDFFEGDYRDNPQPNSFLEVRQEWGNLSLDLYAQPQVNDFYQRVERLPDVNLSAIRQQLGVSPFYYESENSAGYYEFEPGALGGVEFSGMRGDSFHQLLLPKTYLGWLNVTPRVGGRLTHYRDVEGLSGVESEETRTVFNTGLEMTMKASRVWREPRSRLLDVRELRHIVQPSVNYSYVPEPNVKPRELPQFDPEIPSLRLLPIQFPDYNAIDAIDSQNVVRVGLRNKVQTKRAEGTDNLVNWYLVTDFRLDPEGGQGTFADAFSDLDLKPRSWLVLNSQLRYDVDESEWRLATHRLTVLPNNVWSVSLGHRYFKPETALGADDENNLFFSQIYYRFNENWGARISHHFEARDGVLEEQYYTLYRDLRNWTAGLTFRVRDYREERMDYSVAVSLSLKAYPRYGLGRDRDKPEYLIDG